MGDGEAAGGAVGGDEEGEVGVGGGGVWVEVWILWDLGGGGEGGEGAAA